MLSIHDCVYGDITSLQVSCVIVLVLQASDVPAMCARSHANPFLIKFVIGAGSPIILIA